MKEKEAETIPQEFQDNPDIAMALELAKESSYTREELESYDQYLDAIRVEQTVRADSKAEGKAEGRAETLNELAQKLIKEGMSINKVAELTGLSAAELEN